MVGVEPRDEIRMAGSAVQLGDLLRPRKVVRIDGERPSDDRRGGPERTDRGQVVPAGDGRVRVEDDPEEPGGVSGAVEQLPAGELTLAAGVREVEGRATGAEPSPLRRVEVFPRRHGTTITGAMPTLKHHNPDGLHRNPAFTQAVEVSPDTRLLLIGGQNGVDETGRVVSDTVAGQTSRALENVRTAVRAAGGDVGDIAKWTILLTDAGAASEGFAAFGSFWDPATPPPAITVQMVAGLANPDFLVEIEAIAALPR